MGKLSNMQKVLKRFLKHRLGRSTNMRVIDDNISAYMDFNNATAAFTTGSTSEKRYRGSVDKGWYSRLVKALKLEDALHVDHARQGGDISVLVLHLQHQALFSVKVLYAPFINSST